MPLLPIGILLTSGKPSSPILPIKLGLWSPFEIGGETSKPPSGSGTSAIGACGACTRGCGTLANCFGSF